MLNFKKTKIASKTTLILVFQTLKFSCFKRFKFIKKLVRLIRIVNNFIWICCFPTH